MLSLLLAGADHGIDSRTAAHRLNQPIGRTFSRRCDAVLGDGRCKVELDDPAFKGVATVTSAVDNRILTVSGLGGFAPGWFSGGLLIWTGGANEGLSAEAKGHRLSADQILIELWQRAPRMIDIADSFEITAGCDKSLETCAVKFGNVLNHRGFPHMPGNDAAFAYALEDEGVHDGGSYFN